MISNTDLKGAGVPAPIVAGAGDRAAALEFDLVHHLPGRLRLRSAVLKGDTFASEEARRQLAQIDGVTSARANPATGSVLLEYDPNLLSPDKATEVLAAHGCALRATEARTETGGKWADQLASAAMNWAINAIAERLATAMITALA